VAVSVRDDTIFGPHAIPGGEALAITAFAGLVNSFVVSLLALIPKINIDESAVIMAVITIVAIARLQQRLHARRSLIVGAVTLLACAVQFGLGVLLLVNPHDSNQVINLCFVVFVTLIVSLQRVVAAQGQAPGWRGRHRGDRGPRSAARAGDQPAAAARRALIGPRGEGS
jgi:hypothetical protein